MEDVPASIALDFAPIGMRDACPARCGRLLEDGSYCQEQCTHPDGHDRHHFFECLHTLPPPPPLRPVPLPDDEPVLWSPLLGSLALAYDPCCHFAGPCSRMSSYTGNSICAIPKHMPTNTVDYACLCVSAATCVYVCVCLCVHVSACVHVCARTCYFLSMELTFTPLRLPDLSLKGEW